jgi:hypothetical protein
MEEGDEFLWKYLLTCSEGEKGTVQWFSFYSFLSDLWKKETKDKKHLRCSHYLLACLRAAIYCSKECQKRDWRDHKHDCKK